MDAIPIMTEKKKKIDMHVSIASKILYEIKRRGIDKLQDWEDELMKNQCLSSGAKKDLLEWLEEEV